MGRGNQVDRGAGRSCIGEGHGNPLQCSCLENPRDGEAWWAAVYGVVLVRVRAPGPGQRKHASAGGRKGGQWDGGGLGAVGVGTLASTKGEHGYHPRSHGMTRPGTPRQGLWSLCQSPLVPTPGDRGLDAENSEGAPVPRQTAPGAQAADGPSPWGAVSTQGKWAPKEEPWGGMVRASGCGRHQARGRGGLVAEACGPS